MPPVKKAAASPKSSKKTTPKLQSAASKAKAANTDIETKQSASKRLPNKPQKSGVQAEPRHEPVHDRMVRQNQAYARWLKHPTQEQQLGEHNARNAPPPGLVHSTLVDVNNIIPSGGYDGSFGPLEINPGLWFKIAGETAEDYKVEIARKLTSGEIRAFSLFRSYKNTPHSPPAVFLKYIAHRDQHLNDYEDPEKAHALDQQFINSVKRGGASDKNAHLCVADLHGWLNRNRDGVHEVLAHRDAVQKDILEGCGLNVRDIHGEPHVALTRGLKSDIMSQNMPLSSWADVPKTGFGTYQHHAWVPVRDVFYTFCHMHELHSGEMGHENEFLVRPGGQLYEAGHDDIKHTRGKGAELAADLPTRSQQMHLRSDSMTDAGLAAMFPKVMRQFKQSGFRRYRALLEHRNAGPLTYQAALKNGATVEDMLLVNSPAIPREVVLQHLHDSVAKGGLDTDAAMHPALTAEDLLDLVQRLPREAPHATRFILDNPSANSAVADALWKRFGGQFKTIHNALPQSNRLVTGNTLAELVDRSVEEYRRGNGDQDVADLNLRNVLRNPNITEEQTDKIAQALEDFGGDLNRVVFDGRPSPKMLSRILHTTESDQQLRGHVSDYLENRNATEAGMLSIIRDARLRSRLPQSGVWHALCRRHRKFPLPTSVQVAFASQCDQWDDLESLAKLPKLAPETVSVLAAHPAPAVLTALEHNKSIPVADLEAAWPKGVPFPTEFPEEPFAAQKNPLLPLARIIRDRRLYEERKRREHIIKPLPADLAKNEDAEKAMWNAEVEDWLASQLRVDPGYIAVLPQSVADEAMLRSGLVPEPAPEVLEGHAIFAYPMTISRYKALAATLHGDGAILHFRTDSVPAKLPDGRCYWTTPTPLSSAQVLDVAPNENPDEPADWPEEQVAISEADVLREAAQRVTNAHA